MERARLVRQAGRQGLTGCSVDPYPRKAFFLGSVVRGKLCEEAGLDALRRKEKKTER